MRELSKHSHIWCSDKEYKTLMQGHKGHRMAVKKNLTYPDDDPHPLAFRGEGEDLQDVEGEDLSRWSLQLQ